MVGVGLPLALTNLPPRLAPERGPAQVEGEGPGQRGAEDMVGVAAPGLQRAQRLQATAVGAVRVHTVQMVEDVALEVLETEFGGKLRWGLSEHLRETVAHRGEETDHRLLVERRRAGQVHKRLHVHEGATGDADHRGIHVLKGPDGEVAVAALQ